MVPIDFVPAPPTTRARRWGRVLWVVAVAPMAFVLWVLWAPAQVAYRVEDGALVVRTRIGVWREARRIALADVTEARVVHLGRGVRVFGTGMPGYCVGLFRYPDIGTVWQATTCTDEGVLVVARGEERAVLVSPADRGAFLDALDARRDGEQAPARGWEAGTGWHVFRLAFLLLLPGVLVVLWRAPRRLRYRVADGALHVQTLLGRRRVPLAGTRVAAYRPRRAFRTIGSAMPGYYVGRFRIDGRPARAYASRLDEGLVIEGGDRPVFVTPADDGTFRAALRAHGATVET